jgi:hypothetical protein
MSKKLNTIDIKGKKYVLVNERLKYFRENFKDWRLITEIIELTEKRVVLKANILNPNGEVVATGLACEVQGSTNVNKTSHIENCETSAWGRALANFGIGIDSSVASADEVANAILQQQKKPLKEIQKAFEEKNQELSIKQEEEREKKYQEISQDLAACEDADQLKIYWISIEKDLKLFKARRRNLLVEQKNLLKEQFNNN